MIRCVEDALANLFEVGRPARQAHVGQGRAEAVEDPQMVAINAGFAVVRASLVGGWQDLSDGDESEFEIDEEEAEPIHRQAIHKSLQTHTVRM